MILHLFPKSKFAQGFIDFINHNFDSKEHMFVLYTNGDFKVPLDIYDSQNVIDYDNKSIFWLYKNIIKADKLFLHNLSVNIYELFIFSLFPSLLKRSIWLIWGGDLYCYRNPRRSIIEHAIEVARKRVIKKIAVIASLTDGDYSLAQQWYGVNTKHIRLDYYNESVTQILNKILDRKEETIESTINIMVGNSATETNNHIEVFEVIKKYINHDICVYVPLSYGDMTYAGKVEEIGRELLGDKFVPIKNYMGQEEYYSLLNRMDIAIFNNDRQQAIGNIMALALLGKKIYLKDDTSMWNEWVVKGRFVFHKISDLELGFDELRKQELQEKEQNQRAAQDYYKVEKRVDEWKMAFDMEVFNR